MTTKTTNPKSKQIAKVEKTIVDNVLNRINEFQTAGELILPKDYSPENALKSAYLLLLETVDRNKKPVLDVCTKESIANSLLNMVTQGLSPMKKQCYFIAYGDKLQLSRSYQGTIAIAKRVGLKDIVANVIYEKDVFAYEIDPGTGRKTILKHEQKLENIDLNKIKGAYAVVTHSDGPIDVEIMNILQIKKSWMQGSMKGNSGAHTNFTDQMALKTVISRACKTIINSSNDSHLIQEEVKQNGVETNIPETANTKEIGFDEPKQIEEVQEVPDHDIPENEANAPTDHQREEVKEELTETVNAPGF